MGQRRPTSRPMGCDRERRLADPCVGQGRHHLWIGRDGEVVVQPARRRLKAQVAQPHRIRDPPHPLVRTEIVQKAGGGPAAALQTELGAAGEETRLVVGEEEHVGVDDLARLRPQAQDAQRHPRAVGGDGQHDRGAVAAGLTERGGPAGVEAGRHEDRAPVGVEVQDLRSIGTQEEPVVQRPPADLVPATAQDGDVQRVDLGLEQHLGRGRAGPAPPSRPARPRPVPPRGPGAAASSRRPARRSVGTPGSGMIEPTSAPSPANSNEVT